MSLIGIDHSLVSLCPARERMWIRIVKCLAFLDCLTIGAGLSVSLIRLGEYPLIAILAGLFVGGWFAAIQLFMILTNVEGRLKVQGALPRICCIVFLSLCGLAASTGLELGVSLLLTSWSDWMNPLFLLLFLLLLRLTHMLLLQWLVLPLGLSSPLPLMERKTTLCWIASLRKARAKKRRREREKRKKRKST